VIYDWLIVVMIHPDQERCAEDTCKRTAPSMFGWHVWLLIGCYVTLCRCYYHPLASAALGMLLLVVVVVDCCILLTLLQPKLHQQQQQQQPFGLEEVLLLLLVGFGLLLLMIVELVG